MQIILKKTTILSPSSKFHLKKKDIYIKNGIIEKISDSIDVKGAKIIEHKNQYISVGWMDIFSNFCDPGEEQKENIESGTKVAVHGGYTDVCLIPNTKPTMSTKANVEYIKNRTGIVNLHPLGSVSKNCDGKDLSEMYDMKLAGAIAFSDGIKPLQQSGLMLKALQYIKTFDGVIIQIPEEDSIAQNGLMNEGITSTKMGMQGKPAIAESILIQRDLELASYSNSKIHFTGVSTKKSIDLIKQAKKQGIQVSCSVTLYHLLLNDEALENYDSVYKVSPPLRNETDRKALIKAIEDGTIDCIASHHFPQDWDAKQCEFEYAQNGMISLQITLPLLLKVSTKISIEQWIEMITTNPRRILRLDQPKIEEKKEACLTVFNTNETWIFNESKNHSKSANTPFFNQEMTGKIIAVFNNRQANINE